MSPTGRNPLVVFIDHEDSIHTMISDLGAKTSTVSMRRLNQLFELRTIVVPAGDSSGALAVAAIAPLLDATRDILILVDLSFKVSPGPEDVHVGRAIARYIRDHNKVSKPFVWAKPADAILAALQRLPVPPEWVSALARLRGCAGRRS